MKLLIFLSLILSMVSAQGIAADLCPRASEFKMVDFRKEFGPIREQSGVSWCYAYGTADLLTHYLYNQGEISGFSDKEIVSASAIALLNIHEDDMPVVNAAIYAEEYADGLRKENQKLESENKNIIKYLQELNLSRHNSWGDKLERIDDEIRRHQLRTSKIKQKIQNNNASLEKIKNDVPNDYRNSLQTGGTASYAAIAMAKNGICTESAVRSSHIDTWNLLPYGLVDYRGRADKIGILMSTVLDRAPMDPKVVQAMFPVLTEKQIIETKQKHAPADVPYALMQTACEAKSVKNIPKSKAIVVADVQKPKKAELDEIYSSLDEQIEKKNAVIFSTDGDFFDNVGGGYTFETGHAVLVVGKRFNCEFNEVEYIIRNSWGHDACGKYLSDFRRKSNYAQKASERIEKQMYECKAKCLSSDDDEMENIRSCRETCQKTAESRLIEVNKPPYYCEDGHYIVRKSHMMKATKGIRYLY